MKPRREPLRRTAELRAKTELSRTGGLKRVAGPTKPRRQCKVDDCTRTVWAKDQCSMHYQRSLRAGAAKDPAERHAREVVGARAGGVCECCGAQPAREYQHRKARVHCTAAELWDPANGLAVCGHGNLDGCHGRIHSGSPAEAYANGWSVRSCFAPVDIPCLRRGQLVWLRSDGTYIPALGDAA